jgi:uncharacterized membrane protein YcaP (DUF421 family)
MNLFKDFMIVFLRIFTILPFMLMVTLFMGRRTIGEMPIFDFLVVIVIGALVGSDISEPNIPHIHTVVALIFVGILQKIISTLMIKYRKIGKLITFEPVIVIQDGKFIAKSLKKIGYSIDNVLQMLREQEVFDVGEIHLGIIEASGKLSLLKKQNKATVTIEDMHLTKKSPSLSYVVIIRGAVIKDALDKLKLSTIWLEEELMKINITAIDDVFFATVNDNKELSVSLKEYTGEETIPIYN